MLVFKARPLFSASIGSEQGTVRLVMRQQSSHAAWVKKCGPCSTSHPLHKQSIDRPALAPEASGNHHIPPPENLKYLEHASCASLPPFIFPTLALPLSPSFMDKCYRDQQVCIPLGKYSRHPNGCLVGKPGGNLLDLTTLIRVHFQNCWRDKRH